LRWRAADTRSLKMTKMQFPDLSYFILFSRFRRRYLIIWCWHECCRTPDASVYKISKELDFVQLAQVGVFYEAEQRCLLNWLLTSSVFPLISEWYPPKWYPV
jgi:hypothetical protein